MRSKDQTQGFLELYLGNKYFADKANQTIGAPGITEEILMNRRKVTSRLTPEGNMLLDNICQILENHLEVPVTAKWNIFCGCSCPCSPGFRLSAKLGVNGRLGYDNRYSLFMDSDKGVRLNEPKYTYYFHENLPKLKKAFLEIEILFGRKEK